MALGGHGVPYGPTTPPTTRPLLPEEREPRVGKREVQFSAATIALILGLEAVVLGFTGLGASLPHSTSVVLTFPEQNGSEVVRSLPSPSWGGYELGLTFLTEPCLLSSCNETLSVYSCADSTCAAGLTSLYFVSWSEYRLFHYSPPTFITQPTGSAYVLVRVASNTSATSGALILRASTVWGDAYGLTLGGSVWEETFIAVTAAGVVTALSSLAVIRYGHARMLRPLKGR